MLVLLPEAAGRLLCKILDRQDEIGYYDFTSTNPSTPFHTVKAYHQIRKQIFPYPEEKSDWLPPLIGCSSSHF